MLNLLLALLTLGVVGVVAALLTGFLTAGGLAEDESTVPVRALPEGPLSGQEVGRLRFAAALRGYRMDQVDAAMDRLGAELDRLHEQLHRLGAQDAGVSQDAELAGDAEVAGAGAPVAWPAEPDGGPR